MNNAVLKEEITPAPPTQNTASRGIKGVSHECPWVTGAPVRHTGHTHLRMKRQTGPSVGVGLPLSVMEAAVATDAGTDTLTDVSFCALPR